MTRHGNQSALPLDEWHEDDGAVLWWTWPVVEAPWCGTPNDSDWPGYHTHWTTFEKPLGVATSKMERYPRNADQADDRLRLLPNAACGT